MLFWANLTPYYLQYRSKMSQSLCKPVSISFTVATFNWTESNPILLSPTRRLNTQSPNHRRVLCDKWLLDYYSTLPPLRRSTSAAQPTQMNRDTVFNRSLRMRQTALGVLETGRIALPLGPESARMWECGKEAFAFGRPYRIKSLTGRVPGTGPNEKTIPEMAAKCSEY